MKEPKMKTYTYSNKTIAIVIDMQNKFIKDQRFFAITSMMIARDLENNWVLTINYLG